MWYHIAFEQILIKCCSLYLMFYIINDLCCCTPFEDQCEVYLNWIFPFFFFLFSLINFPIYLHIFLMHFGFFFYFCFSSIWVASSYWKVCIMWRKSVNILEVDFGYRIQTCICWWPSWTYWWIEKSNKLIEGE